MSDRIKAVVCGTTFGQFYCEALKKSEDRIDFCGILAAGSERSVKCAEHYGVKLYRSVSEIPDDVKLACVVTRSGVLGGIGTDLSKQFLERGINVIQEQPVHFRDITECAHIAGKNGVFYRVGDLYRHLPNVKCFTEAAKKLSEVSEIQFIEVGTASQVSYPVFEIISEIVKSVRPFSLHNIGKNDRPFQTAEADIGGVPVLFTVQNQVNPEDPDNFMHYLFRFELITSDGRLRLDDAMGGVYWYNKMFVPVHGGIVSELSDDPDLAKKSVRELYRPQSKEFSKIFTEEWIPAIGKDIENYLGIIEQKDSKAMNMYYNKTLAASKMWHEFTSEIGFPSLISGKTVSSEADSLMSYIENSGN